MGKRIIKNTLIATVLLLYIFSAGVSASGGDLLQRGDTSENVKLLQQLLQDKGYYTYSEVTGYYGVITEDAVKAFQAAKGLRVDGITGPATWAALLAESEDVPSSEAASDSIHSIGMECADVALIQTRLKELGFYNYDYITGYFGTITQNAVKAFQRSSSLEVTGAVDEQTWAVLFSDYLPGALSSGTVGDQVVPLQQRLIELGYYSFGADGIYGPKTKEAVVYFQKVSGLTANGIADQETIDLLFSDDAIYEQDARRMITTNVTISSQAATKPKGDDIVIIAKQYLGSPYVYGGQGPDAFDADGFIKYVYDLAGVTVSNSLLSQYQDNFGIKIYNRDDLLPGDLVFFDTMLTDGSLTDHVGIYIGDGNFIHVDDRLGKNAVVIDSLTKSSGWYAARFTWARRIIEQN